ncbi:MAG: sigma-70 family RNA polymerase sigma factor [Tepidiformaceae bacterium]
MQSALQASEAAAAPAPATVEPAVFLAPEELCDRYAERVYRFSAMVSRGDVEADDLAQDALERAIRRVDTFDPGRGTIESWLWRIVVSVAADHGRLARRRHLLREKLTRLRDIPDGPLELPGAVDPAELLAAIRRLRPRDRELVALRYGAGLDYAEVGAALGMTGPAAGVAGRRALARLRDDLLGNGRTNP